VTATFHGTARGALQPLEATPTNVGDGLAQIDGLLELWSLPRDAFAEQQAEAKTEREQFVLDATQIVVQVIRPAMEAASGRLSNDGGCGQSCHQNISPCRPLQA
jgi:hypothetical protein